MGKVRVFIHWTSEITSWAPVYRKIERGNKLLMNAIFIALLYRPVSGFMPKRAAQRGPDAGEISAMMVTRRPVGITAAACIIASTWICAKSFWFLRPGDELLSFRSSK